MRSETVLDTSVVTFILDGELWSREPACVVSYHVDLQAALFHTQSATKSVLNDLELCK